MCPRTSLQRHSGGLAYRGLDTRSQERDREPTDAELSRLYKHWDNNSRQKIPMTMLCKFALATGMRQGEICRLEIEDLDRAEKTIIIRDRKDPKNKQGNDQKVPLLPDAWAIVEPLIKNRTSGFLFHIRRSACQPPSPAHVRRWSHPLWICISMTCDTGPPRHFSAWVWTYPGWRC